MEKTQLTKKQNRILNDVANTLVGCKSLNRWRDNFQWNQCYDDVYGLLARVASTDTFGGQIAKGVLERAEEWAKKTKKEVMPYLSAKQSWCIAFCVIENNIEWREGCFDDPYDFEEEEECAE